MSGGKPNRMVIIAGPDGSESELQMATDDIGITSMLKVQILSLGNHLHLSPEGTDPHHPESLGKTQSHKEVREMKHRDIRGANHYGKGVERMRMNKNTNLGMILLAVYLILTGLMQVVEFPIPAIAMAILAIAAGVLILMNK